MTALIGSAMFGLVPLPSMVTADTWGSRCDHWPSEAANSAHRIFPPQPIIERLAAREELAGLRHGVGDIDADLTRTTFRHAGMKKGRTEYSC